MDINEFIELDSAKERFMENEELYKSFLFELPQRDLHAQLKAAVRSGDVEEAFQIAHKMKGIIQNLSLNLLGKEIEEKVEVLRRGENLDAEQMRQLDEAYQSSMENIAYIKENDLSLF